MTESNSAKSKCCRAEVKIGYSSLHGSGDFCGECGLPCERLDTVPADSEAEIEKLAGIIAFLSTEGMVSSKALAGGLFNSGYRLMPKKPELKEITQEQICKAVCQETTEICEWKSWCGKFNIAKRAVEAKHAADQSALDKAWKG